MASSWPARVWARLLRALTDPADWTLTVVILLGEVLLNALIIWRVPCATGWAVWRQLPWAV